MKVTYHLSFFPAQHLWKVLIYEAERLRSWVLCYVVTYSDSTDSVVLQNSNMGSSNRGNHVGHLLFLALFCYTVYHTHLGHTHHFPKLATPPLILLEVTVLLFCEFGPVSLFLAR